jgi:hypothetical protein
VVPPAQARAWKLEVEDYARANPSHAGFPAEDPQVLELYWSRPQLEARQHPNVHATMLALVRLWSDATAEQVGFDDVFTCAPPGFEVSNP